MIARLVRSAGAVSLLLLAACSSFVKFPNSAPLARALAAGPTQAEMARDTLAQASARPVGAIRAPICQASQTCAALDAEQIPLSCVKKVPYTNVLVPVGSTFEVVDQSGDFVCLDTGVVANGKEVITCHGTELYSFQLRLTNTACSGATLKTGTGQCDDGYGFDTEQKCCAPVGADTANSTIVTVNLGACPLPNP